MGDVESKSACLHKLKKSGIANSCLYESMDRSIPPIDNDMTGKEASFTKHLE